MRAVVRGTTAMVGGECPHPEDTMRTSKTSAQMSFFETMKRVANAEQSIQTKADNRKVRDIAHLGHDRVADIAQAHLTIESI